MPKKKTRLPANNAKKNKKAFSFRKYFIILAGLFAISLFAILFTDKLKEPDCANSITCIKDLSGKPSNDKVGYFMGNEVSVPEIASVPQTNSVLGDTTSDKHIYVDLTAQRLYAKEGDKIIYEFLISSGKWGKTPTGDFMTWIKLKSTRMTGGNKTIGTFYDLPNVPYTMYFYNNSVPKYKGFGVHGAYWHNNFGHPMSHGCINVKPEEAGLLFAWANPQSDTFTTYVDTNHPGTPITIYGTAPLN